MTESNRIITILCLFGLALTLVLAFMIGNAHAQEGIASVYNSGYKTASGARFNPHCLCAASKTLPLGSRARVTNHSNGRSIVVLIDDRGPFVRGRVIDLTPAAAYALGVNGLARVTVTHE